MSFQVCGIPMVTIPAGVFNGMGIDAFQLGRTPVTNAQYATHVDRFLDRPHVLLQTDPETHATSVLCRVRTPEEALGNLAKHLAAIEDAWNSRDAFTFGVLTLIQLRKDMSGDDFDWPNQPVVNVSWFHAFEYCITNGLFLPSDDQWEHSARGPEGHEYGTRSGQLTKEEAHYDAESTADVVSYPPNGFGLQDMTGNVAEWTARNPARKYPYGVRGGAWVIDDRERLRVAFRDAPSPVAVMNDMGFRVGAPAPQDS